MKAKTLFLLAIILSMPFTVSSAFAAPGDPVPLPGDQCNEKIGKTDHFVDTMDNGVIKTLEAIASLTYAIATTINSVDAIFSTLGSTIGEIGPDGSGFCPIAALGVGVGICEGIWEAHEGWQTVTSTPILQAIVTIGSCACCSSTDTGLFGGDGLLAGGGDLTDLCPLGNLANNIGGILPEVSGFTGPAETPAGTPVPTDLPEAQFGRPNFDPFTDTTGSSQFHLSAFDNIYTAVGCLCPVAILLNLRKLKTIYQVRSCCYEEMCTNGESTTVCDRQFDEATCMYYEGSWKKTLITVVVSVIAGYISQHVFEWLTSQSIPNVVLAILDVTRLPARVQAVIDGWQWFGYTFGEPSCSDLGYGDVKDALDTGYFGPGAIQPGTEGSP